MNPSCAITQAVTTFAAPTNATLAVLSVAVALAAFVVLRGNLSPKAKAVVVYIHLLALFFPVSLFTAETTCAPAACGMTYAPAYCQSEVLKTAGFALPLSVTLATVFAVVIIPLMFLRSSKNHRVKRGWMFDFLSKSSAELGIKTPKLFLFDSPKPTAFSFTQNIFLSIGLTDLLTRRETEAVLLHELAHLKHQSSLSKLSSLLMRLSPFNVVRSLNEVSCEESKADALVVQLQGTPKFLNGAKSKVELFYK